jgi:hypothetical protein
MGKRAQDSTSGSRAVRTWITALLLGLSTAACTEANGLQTSRPATSRLSDPSASPTPTSAASTPAPSHTSGPGLERLITQRYVDFQRVATQAGATSNSSDPRLAEYATGAVLENLRGKLAVRRQAGTRLYGAPVPHVQSVSVSGDRATVRDCLDNSATGLVDRAGKKLSVGRERQQTTATLVLAGGTWKVSDIATVAGGGSC